MMMNDEKWEQLKDRLGKRFEVLDERHGDLMADTPEGEVKQGEQDIVVVHTPAGKIRLVREIRPLILEKKMHYTHRQGQSAQVEYLLSDTEKTYKLRVFKWIDLEDDWQEIDLQNAQGII